MYKIKELADLAQVSTRTLRYYDRIHLLKPSRITASGYRMYGEEELLRLQKILFFKEMDFSLEQIMQLIDCNEAAYKAMLRAHLKVLEQERTRIGLLIENITHRIGDGKDNHMRDTEKFMGFKKVLIEENDAKYGEEIRTKYGKENIEASYDKFMKLNPAQYEHMQNLGKEICVALEKAVQSGASPSDAAGREIAQKHVEWIYISWSQYSKEAHLGLLELYVNDPRFTQYYDAHVSGCAAFLKQAVEAYLEE